MIERLSRFLAGASFHRGLALGALVGAAIAGSTLWGRIKQARETPRDPSDDPGRGESAPVRG